MTSFPPHPNLIAGSLETFSKNAWLKEVQRQLKRVERLKEKYGRV